MSEFFGFGGSVGGYGFQDQYRRGDPRDRQPRGGYGHDGRGYAPRQDYRDGRGDRNRDTRRSDGSYGQRSHPPKRPYQGKRSERSDNKQKTPEAPTDQPHKDKAPPASNLAALYKFCNENSQFASPKFHAEHNNEQGFRHSLTCAANAEFRVDAPGMGYRSKDVSIEMCAHTAMLKLAPALAVTPTVDQTLWDPAEGLTVPPPPPKAAGKDLKDLRSRRGTVAVESAILDGGWVDDDVPILQSFLQRSEKGWHDHTLDFGAKWEKKIEPADVEALCARIAAVPAITRVVFGERNAVGNAGAEAVGKLLAAAPSITAVDLSGSDIDEKGAASLAEGLQANTTLRELVLVYNSLGDEGAELLAPVLATAPALVLVDLRNNDISPKGAATLAAAMRSNTHLNVLCSVPRLLLQNSALRELMVQKCDLLTCNILRDVAPLAHSLCRLDVVESTTAVEGLELLADAVVSCPSLKAFCSLNLEPLRDPATTTLSCKRLLPPELHVFMRLARNHPNVTTLDLDSADLTDGQGVALAELCAAKPKITKLLAAHNHLGADAIKALVGVSSLRELDVRRNASLDAAGITEVTEAVVASSLEVFGEIPLGSWRSGSKSNQTVKFGNRMQPLDISVALAALRAAPSVECVEITQLGLESAAPIVSLLTDVPTITSLDVSSNKLNDAEAALIAAVPTLTSLNLTNNSTTAAGARTLAEMPTVHALHRFNGMDLSVWRTAEVIDLNGVKSKEGAASTGDVSFTMKVFANNEVAHTIDCAGVSLRGLASELIGVLAARPNITTLRARGCGLTGSEVVALLKASPTLRSVEVSCGKGDEASIVAAVKESPALEEFNGLPVRGLVDNTATELDLRPQLNDDLAFPIAIALLKHNTSVTSVDLSECNISEPKAVILRDLLLPGHASIKDVNFLNCQMTLQAFTKLKEAASAQEAAGLVLRDVTDQTSPICYHFAKGRCRYTTKNGECKYRHPVGAPAGAAAAAEPAQGLKRKADDAAEGDAVDEQESKKAKTEEAATP